jgi:hypothetical protein
MYSKNSENLRLALYQGPDMNITNNRLRAKVRLSLTISESEPLFKSEIFLNSYTQTLRLRFYFQFGFH